MCVCVCVCHKDVDVEAVLRHDAVFGALHVVHLLLHLLAGPPDEAATALGRARRRSQSVAIGRGPTAASAAEGAQRETQELPLAAGRRGRTPGRAAAVAAADDGAVLKNEDALN